MDTVNDTTADIITYSIHTNNRGNRSKFTYVNGVQKGRGIKLCNGDDDSCVKEAKTGGLCASHLNGSAPRKQIDKNTIGEITVDETGRRCKQKIKGHRFICKGYNNMCMKEVAVDVELCAGCIAGEVPSIQLKLNEGETGLIPWDYDGARLGKRKKRIDGKNIPICGFGDCETRIEFNVNACAKHGKYLMLFDGGVLYVKK